MPGWRSGENGWVSKTPERARRRVSLPVVIGIILLALGVGAFGWIAWEYWGTDGPAIKAQQEEKAGLKERWRTPLPSAGATDKLVPGDAMALMRIPDLGPDWEQPVLIGTDDRTLMRGLGWYESSAEPGEIGNFAVAGHRSGHGRPFDHLLDLKPGSKVEIETRTHVYVYVLDNSPKDLTVKNSDVWVLDPVPGKPDEQPTRALITLTTCEDFFSSPDRSIGFGHLAETRTK